MKLCISLLLVAEFVATVVHGHGTEVRRCITPEGNLRIFIEHWHGDLSDPGQAGTMTIQQNHLAGSPTTTLFPSGTVNNLLPGSLPGCITGTADTLVTTCSQAYNDWVWYDFPVTCNQPVSYTLLAGNTVVLTEGCGALYPATIAEANGFTDQGGPAIAIDGQPCEGHVVMASTADACTPSGVATWVPTVADDCDPNPSIPQSSLQSGDTFLLGDTPVTISASDNLGQLTTCTFTVRMSSGADADPPALTCPADVVATTDPGTCQAGVSYDAVTATDTCGDVNAILSAGIGSSGSFPLGETTETYTATDPSGNSGSCSLTVSVSDPEDPVVSCPADVTVAANDQCGAIVDYDVTSSDNCPGIGLPALSAGLASGAMFPLGTTAQTYSATDAAGNTASCSFDVAVTNEVPVADAGGPYIIMAGTAGALAGVAGDANNAYTTQWTTDCPGSFDDDSSLTAELAVASGAEPTICAVTLTAMDCETSTSSVAIVVIVDPAAGFITGGGWIASPEGAYVADPSLTGKANFGFVAKYKKGQTVPSGQTQFVFHEPGFDFHSTSYEWLVVTGSDCAKFKGDGEVNGGGLYGFMLTACDGGEPGVDDTFRLKVWDSSSGDIVYDNQLGVDDGNYDGTIISGGNIQIHQQGGKKLRRRARA